MTNFTKPNPTLKHRRGATIVVVAVVLPLLIGMAALAIDIGYVYATKNELQNVADAAALAAAGQLGEIYRGLSYAEQQDYACDPATIAAMAQDVAGKNQAASQSISINTADIIIGQWNPFSTASDRLTPTLDQPDAVRVIARRDGEANGPITTFFAGIFRLFGAVDPEIVPVTAVATAALTGQGSVNEGDLVLPVGIPLARFLQPFCGETIQFSPPDFDDPNSCAGWTDFETDASVPPGNIEDILDGTTLSPELDAYEDWATFNNGVLNTHVFEAALTRYEQEGYDILDQYGNRTPLYGDDGVQLRYPPCSGGSGNCSGALRYAHQWDTSIVVYNSDTCIPNDTYEIIGFAEVEIFDVRMPPDNLIIGRIKCGAIDDRPTRGGGGNFGKLGPIPGLVE